MGILFRRGNERPLAWHRAVPSHWVRDRNRGTTWPRLYATIDKALLLTLARQSHWPRALQARTAAGCASPERRFVAQLDPEGDLPRRLPRGGVAASFWTGLGRTSERRARPEQQHGAPGQAAAADP